MKIELQNICKTFRDADHELRVIDDLSFTFPAAGSLAIVGRSGVGKSTLLHMLGGLERPSSGSILLDGEDLTLLGADELSAFRADNIGFIFQFHHLLPEFSALENVSMPLIIRGEEEQPALHKAEQILARVGLADRLSHLPSQLSGGEQQRVAVARAVVGRPKLLLADEPTGNLDQVSSELVQKLLLELSAELGNLLVVVTHSSELAASLGGVVELLPGGKLTMH